MANAGRSAQIFHAAWDWSQSFLYGVADSGLFTEHRLMLTHPVGAPLFSGGTTGPEGSIYILPLLALMAVIIRFTLPRYRFDQLMRLGWKIFLPTSLSSATSSTRRAHAFSASSTIFW